MLIRRPAKPKENMAMKRVLIPSVALLIAGMCTATSADVTSGLQVGEKTKAYNVKDVTGPKKGSSLCYR